MKNASGSKRGWILVVLLGALFVAFAADAGRMLVVDAPERSDVILVLAGETDRRPALGLQLLDQGYGGRLIIDVPAAAKIYGFTQLQFAEKYFQNLPEGKSIQICPIVGLSTKEESHDTEKCLDRDLEQKKGARVLIVTSDFHTRRALAVFRHEVKGRSFSIAAAHDDTQFGTRWWTHRQWAKTCVDEWLRLIWWTVVDRWR